MMRKLQDSILSLLVLFTILFNIERLDFNAQNIDLDTLVYVLTVVAVMMILLIKELSRLRQTVLLTLATGVFFIVKLLSVRPLAGDIYTYLSFTELGLFLAAVFLAQNLANNIRELQENPQSFSLASVRKIKRVEEAYKEIEAEIYRSRRFQRPLSVIVLEKDSENFQTHIEKLTQNTQRALIEQYFSVILAKELAAQLRETDLLLENDRNGQLVIISPDTGVVESETLIKRLKALMENAEFSINFGAATFPDHALAFEQLLEHAEMDLRQRVNGHIKVDMLKEV